MENDEEKYRRRRSTFFAAKAAGLTEVHSLYIKLLLMEE